MEEFYRMANCLSRQMYGSDLDSLKVYQRENVKGLLSDLFQRKILSFKVLVDQLIK
jgi:transcriptional regulator of NAD metabolism